MNAQQHSDKAAELLAAADTVAEEVTRRDAPLTMSTQDAISLVQALSQLAAVHMLMMITETY